MQQDTGGQAFPGKGGMDMDQRGYQDAAAVLPLRLRREAMALPQSPTRHPPRTLR